MKAKRQLLIICILIPLFVGSLSSLISGQSMEIFAQLNQPVLAPPGYLFPIVWTILYILMGVASYLVLTSEEDPSDIRAALFVYSAQLAVNFFWSIIFFNLGWYLFAFIWLLLLLTLIVITIILFWRTSKTAAYLLIPYAIWVVFAGYLNLSIYLLN